jgi:glycerol-3-phosphate dehydrogenase
MALSARDDQLARLAAGVDVLVIGGGITGAGVALDAATRGYRVGLVEQADFASGTSSRSTKLVHGGLRYLARAELGLVAEALRERVRLLQLAPHLVQPQPFLLPLYDRMARPLGLRLPPPLRRWTPAAVGLVLWGYDRLARAAGLRHRRLTATEASTLVPALRTERLQSAFLLYDAAADDVRLTHAVLASARQFGAVTVNYARAASLLPDRGRVAGAVVEDRLTGRSVVVRARHVVNAAGVWAEEVAALDGRPAFRLRPSKGVHLVLRREVLGAEVALILPETEDGRVAFVVPWAGRALLGTTDDPYTGPLDGPVASRQEAAYLLRHARRYLRRVERGDVVGVCAGLRPLMEGGGGRVADLSRRHASVESPRGLVSIIGGKLTTYRQMAEETVDLLARRDGGGRPCRTATLPLVGSAGLAEAEQVLASSGLAREQQRHLLRAYGGASMEVLALAGADPTLLHPLVDGLPVVAAEVVYACQREQAVSLADVMFLRTRLSVLADDAGEAALERVSELMTAALGWSAAEQRRQRERWEAAVDREREALADLA